MSETKNQGIPQVTEWGLSALAPTKQNERKKKKKSLGDKWSLDLKEAS